MVFICSVAFKTVYVSDLLAEVYIETTLIVGSTRLYDSVLEIFQISCNVYKRKLTLDSRPFYVRSPTQLRNTFDILFRLCVRAV